MTREIAIVDRGRGWQLSTSRITVQDLVPYFQRGDSHEQILRWIPAIDAEELRLVERFYRDHQGELDEQDRRIRARTAARAKPPEVEEAEHRQRLERLESVRSSIRAQRQERNGDLAPG